MNGVFRKHWIFVAIHCAIDGIALFASFVIGIFLRFEHGVSEIFFLYWPGMVLGSLFFPSAVYICGLYSSKSYYGRILLRVFTVTVCLGLTFCLLAALFYLNWSTRIGRGVMLMSAAISYGLILIHHLHSTLNRRKNHDRVAILHTSSKDEIEAGLLEQFLGPEFKLVGYICDVAGPQDKIPEGAAILGSMDNLVDLVQEHNIQRIVCTDADSCNARLYKKFCKLRYSGVTVTPLISISEEVHQYVPLQLVTPEWLLSASSTPHMSYIKKTKRAFDIITSFIGGVVLSPFLLMGMLAIRLSSKGPIFYRQTRAGRFGREFDLIKLRTMRVDAEKDGAVWSCKDDPRVLPVGHILRKYRIDEIPQIFNVLKGEMSFVGPRPERPDFIVKLDKEIPFNGERLMIQPGITGWAQVNYPYGSSIEDSRRKLEYDLYYMKNMSLFIDMFILLDTVRIILKGGSSSKQTENLKKTFPVKSLRAVPAGADVKASELA